MIGTLLLARRFWPAVLILPLASAHAGWRGLSKDAGTDGKTAAAIGDLAQAEVSQGLKEALSRGVKSAVSKLGRDGGFLKNLDVKIPMPNRLQKLDQTLRKLKQDKLADEFVVTMNRAAEKAVPEAAALFADSISQMTLADAQAILSGPEDSATRYFRRTSESRLRQKFLPIVSKATASAGVTVAYRRLLAAAGPAAFLLGPEASNLDGYITTKALDGLFKMIAAEEKKIRRDPVARTSDILRKVFGSLKK